ncbi:MAG: fatty acid desaturase [Pseudomonadota bacterium]
MDEQFEQRPLLPVARMRELVARSDFESAIRLVLHLTAFVSLIAAIVVLPKHWAVDLALSICLAWVWSALFAPFHECTHRTAFKSKLGNRIGVWLTGIPFGMAPAVYRTFHYEHHRHTQDPDKDPELTDPRYAHWPENVLGWIVMASGYGLIMLKLRPLIAFLRLPIEQWRDIASWAPKIDNPRGLKRECYVIAGLWLVFVGASLFWVKNGIWLVAAAWLAHGFQALWVASEHTGLPPKGTILDRTRSVISNRFVRWWLWNMNYHAEHHAWPGIPWYRLPLAHEEVRESLGSLANSYGALHANIIRGVNRPTCDTGA